MSSKIRETNEIRVIDPREPVKLINVEDNSPEASAEPITVIDAFEKTVKNFPQKNALMYKDESSGEKWNSVTYAEYKSLVDKMSKVFIKLGLERHGTVAVLAFNCKEWFIAELATMHAGGVITGIYTTNSADACYHILESSKANIVIVDDDHQMKKIHEIKDKLPHLKAVVQIHAPYASHVKKSDGYYRWMELEEMSVNDEGLEDEYQRRKSSVAANECCVLVFTSGTVGNPKGAMLSHDNLIWVAQTGIASFGKIDVGNEVFVSYLPMSHVAAQVLDISAAIQSAATIYFADKNAMKGTLMETLKEAQPTLFFTVPRLFEKMHEKMLIVGSQSGALKRTLGSWAKRVTLKHHMNRIKGQSTNESVQFRLASKLILSKVKEALGFNRCRTFFTGAAPLSADIKEYFLSLDIVIYEGYGMSEAIIHSITSANTKSLDSVGLALPGTQTKIININEDGHGEICMRGRHVFMGYINDLEKTIEAIDDERWLRTGDVGYQDNDGYIYVTGRIKELIVTAGGENIPYLLIENTVKNECRAIANAFLVGDRKKFLTMLITIKTEIDGAGAPKDDLTTDAQQWFENVGQSYTKLSQVLDPANLPKVTEAIQECMNRSNAKAISNAQKVQKFALLPHDFTIATGELTPTMKLKRNVVLKKYKDIIDRFYE